MIGVLVMGNAQTAFATHLRATRRPWLFSAIAASRLIIVFAATLVLLIHLKLGIVGLLSARLIGDTGAVLLYSFFIYPEVRLRLLPDVVGPMLRFGAPVVLTGLAPLAMDSVARYTLAHQAGLVQVGVYALALKVAAILQFSLVQPFAAAWGGMMFQLSRRPDAPSAYGKAFILVACLGLCGALALHLFSPAFVRLLGGNDFSAAAVVVLPLALVQLCVLVQYPASIGIYLRNRTKIIMPVTLVGLLLAWGTTFVLIPRLQSLGAGIGMLTGWTAIVIGYFWSTRQSGDIRVNWRPLILAVCAGLVLALVAHSIQFTNFSTQLAFRSLLLFAYACTLATYLIHTQTGDLTRLWFSMLSRIKGYEFGGD
jgi:O-antigen/teichoic acid export membrane protein